MRTESFIDALTLLADGLSGLLSCAGNFNNFLDQLFTADLAVAVSLGWLFNTYRSFSGIYRYRLLPIFRHLLCDISRYFIWCYT